MFCSIRIYSYLCSTKVTNQISNNILILKIMKTEVYIYNLNGNRAEVRDYANTIASMSAKSSNAYVMAFDADDEIAWTIQAGDDLDDVKASINWQGVRRVEIYDHSFDGSYKCENVYVTSQKSLDRYTRERSADDYDVKSNTTPYTADNWQTSDNSDTHNSNSDTPTDPTAEPSHLAQVAVSVKAYAVQTVKRCAFAISLAVVAAVALLVYFGSAMLVLDLCDAFHLSHFVRGVLYLFVLIGPALEIAVNIEHNLLAVVARLFPSFFWRVLPFECFSFWGRMCRA